MSTSSRSPQRVANELEKNGRELEFRDEQLQEGILPADPILSSLATGIALKAWQYSKRQEPPDGACDLLRLFKSLKQHTQEMLEAMMRRVGPLSVCAGT